MGQESQNLIVVKGEKIPTKIEEIDIFKLKYWKENPRVNAIIKQKYQDKIIPDDIIEKELWEKDSVKDLYKDIERHGGLIDEILVKGDMVLEGNSRLCAYRHLYNNAVKKKDENEQKKWSKIRARIIPNDTPDEIVFSILGVWHIKGKAQWDTYEKAAYLKRIHVDYNFSFKDIADSISQTEKFVKDHIEAYDMMVEYNVFSLEKFSYFYELVKNKKIHELVEKEPSTKVNVIEAIKENRFNRAEEIRELPKVLKDKKAKKEFIDNKVSFCEALEISNERHPENKNSFYNNIKKITNILKNLKLSEIEKIKNEINNDKQKKYILEQLRKEVNSLFKKIDLNN
jgi:hypothetical protein